MLKRWLQNRSPTITTHLQRRPTLHVEALEARDVPSVSLIGINAANSAQANAPTNLIDNSGDGRYVLFSSTATDLVTGQVDVAATPDLFWRDTQTGVTRLVTAKAGSLELSALGDYNGEAALSFDGLTVVFGSPTNAELIDSTIAAGKDTAGVDYFAWRITSPAAASIVRAVTVRADGTFIGITNSLDAPAVSDDGKYVAYASDIVATAVDPSVTNDMATTLDLFRRDITDTNFATATRTVTVRNGFPTDAIGNVESVIVSPNYMSGDGRFFVFNTVANATTAIDATLVDGASTSDVFVRDMDIASGGFATKALSVLPTLPTTLLGASANNPDSSIAQISRNGQAVIFLSTAPGLAPTDELVTGFIDNNGAANPDLYVSGNPFLPAPSGVRLVTAKSATTATGGSSVATFATISGNASVVAYNYDANDLVNTVTDTNNVSDVFVYSLATGKNSIVSVNRLNNSTGALAATLGTVSDDGRYISFTTANNAAFYQFHVTDANNANDAFVRDRTNGVTRVVSVIANGGVTGNGPSTALDAASDSTGAGRTYFSSSATNLSNIATTGVADFVATIPTGGLKPFAPGSQILAVSGGSNGSVIVYSFGADGKTVPLTNFVPFPGFGGEVRTATGDIDGDGVADYVAAAGPGGAPQVRVISGATGETIRNFFAFESSFTGGVFVTVADFDQDGFDDLVLSADNGGGPRVRVLSGKDGQTLVDFLAIEDPNFRGGTRPSVGDVNGDGVPDLFVGAGFTGGPRVALYDGISIAGGAPQKFFGDFFIFESTLRNGAFSAVGDLDGDGFGDLIAGGGPGGGPRVFAVSGRDLLTSNGQSLSPVANFFAGNPTTTGGVRVVAKDIDGDNLADLVTGLGEGAPATVTTFRGSAIGTAGANALPASIESFTPFAGLTGIHVG